MLLWWWWWFVVVVVVVVVVVLGGPLRHVDIGRRPSERFMNMKQHSGVLLA